MALSLFVMTMADRVGALLAMKGAPEPEDPVEEFAALRLQYARERHRPSVRGAGGGGEQPALSGRRRR